MLVTRSKSVRHVCFLGLFVLGAFLIYSNILTSYFLSDDFAQIGKVLSGDRSVVWGQMHGGFFRPLFILSYMIDSSIWRARPFGYHLTNVVFHALSSFLTYLFALRLLEHIAISPRTKEKVSLAASLLFLLHPSHTEVVSWISGRADAIATFLCLASLLWFLTYAKNMRTVHLAGSLACFGLAVLAKESAICLPFLVLALSTSRFYAHTSNKSFRQTVKATAPFFFILLAFILVRALFLGTLVGGYGTSQHLNFSFGWLRDRFLEASLRSVLPALPSSWASFLYKPLKSPLFILLAVLSLVLIASAIVVRRNWYTRPERKEQNRLLLELSALFLFSLLPVISLRLSLYNTQGERFLYLPSVFSSLILSYLLVMLIRKTKLFLAILICLLCFYSIALYRTNRIWREAAQLSLSIKDDLFRSSIRSQVLVLNAPDNLRGVPVYHNGLPEVIKYFANQNQIQQVAILSFQNLETLHDRVQLDRGPEYLTLNTLNDHDSFDRVSGSNCVDVINHSRNSVRFQVKDCGSRADLFFFDNGDMVLLNR